MPTLLSMALGAAPIFGGALLTAAAGQLKGPDLRGLIKQDLDLLDRIPAEQTKRRAELQRTIDERIDDLVAASDRTRALRAAALSYQGNWRDVVLFACSVLFTYVWWHINHERGNWLPMFVVLVVVCVTTAVYALRGTLRSLAHSRRGRA
ncbi:hypothetical protein EHH44_03785 [Mycolicibacter terrae]|uniref:Transmembrane protein n=2 Tax=Mycolicibacter TaxID=1073531 RepID=A0A1A2XRX8_MYCSD|nr:MULTISPECIES: hypothetical protein [Mycolicibacter]OBH17592.1 hypothetical protein A5694_00170 [Mycolicibacter sinensis]OBI27847.1 hypothetical protein A5710_04920 [Mycolicibacter sinensis]RRR47635.1 hypothetical protein EHH44_03785 [Mycolicibacter terrae]